MPDICPGIGCSSRQNTYTYGTYNLTGEDDNKSVNKLDNMN